MVLSFIARMRSVPLKVRNTDQVSSVKPKPKPLLNGCILPAEAVSMHEKDYTFYWYDKPTDEKREHVVI